MSDSWIIIIPEAPRFVPSEEARRKAVAFFRSIAQAWKVNEETSDAVRFIDCGENFERVLCPDCGAELDLNWWQDRMHQESEAGFPLHAFTLPCCQARRTLNDLKYDWPQGFARCSIEAMNPNIGDLTDEQLKEFEMILGCRVRKVLQHI